MGGNVKLHVTQECAASFLFYLDGYVFVTRFLESINVKIFYGLIGGNTRLGIH